MYPIVRRSAAPTTRSLFDGFLDDDWGFAPIFNAFLSDAFTDNNRTLSSVRANVTTNENDHRVDCRSWSRKG